MRRITILVWVSVATPRLAAGQEGAASEPEGLGHLAGGVGVAPLTTVGGYGELHYNLLMPSGGEREAVLDLHRLVVAVAHDFGAGLRVYAELELEHALVEADAPGEIAVEQAYVDYAVRGDKLGVRAGVILMPMGIINRSHEPPVFNGVERPRVEQVIIPTTWREGGIGLFGRPCECWRWEVYVVGGLDPLGFSTAQGIREGAQEVAEARARGLALTGRIEAEPVLGLVLGVAGYYGEAGPNAGVVHDATGNHLELAVPVLGGAVDARFKWRGLEARALIAGFVIGNAAKLRTLFDESGAPIGADTASRSIGTYVEVGYDVLNTEDTDAHLTPFVRLEVANPAAQIKGRARTALDDAQRSRDLVFGLTYRPIEQVALKGDVILRQPGGAAEESGETLVDLGVGFMF